MLCGSELQKNLVSNGGKSTDFGQVIKKWHPKTEHSNIGHENIQHSNVSGTRLSGILIPTLVSHKMFLWI